MKNAAMMMKKTAPKFVDDTHVQVTKQFAKNARIFGTPEYKMWKEIRMDCPDAVMVTKTIKKNPNKRNSTKNMTYPRMEIFISQQENAVTLLTEFRKQQALSKVQNDPYRYVLAWFLKTFENYDEDYHAFFEAQAKKEAQKKDIFTVINASAVVEMEDTDEEEYEFAANM